MSHQHWQPTTDINVLKARAEMLGKIRSFFLARHVLEVDTPILSAAAGPDPSLDPITASVKTTANSEQVFFLQTSPEFAMKRLLASGSGAIYQLAKSFRNAEIGKKHNPEFTMLEWYRPGFTLTELMDEVESLVTDLLSLEKPERLTYRELFMRYLNIDPFNISLPSLQEIARTKIEINLDSDNPDYWLDLLFSHCIEPELEKPVFITDYPPTQSALAKLAKNDEGNLVAKRFELVAHGMELANGYQELTDPIEQGVRFKKDLVRRNDESLPIHPVDKNLLAALESGLPECAGVAMGVDRLLMLKIGKNAIREIISFPIDKA